MTIFVLVHGGGSGPWTWRHLVERLSAEGHKTICPDLGNDENASLADYRESVISALPEDASDVVVVGHSGIGSCVAVMVASEITVRRFILLAGTVPYPGVPLSDAMKQQLNYSQLLASSVIGEDGNMSFSLESRRYFFSFDVQESVFKEQSELARAQPIKVQDDVVPLENFPSVPFTAILGRHDRAVNFEAVSSRVTNRGGEVIAMECGHAPHLSHASSLARTLISITS